MNKSKLSMEKTTDIKKELDARGYNTTSITPSIKTWTIGIQKILWQYFENIEADTREQAIEIALSRVKENNWEDFKNNLIISDCYETKGKDTKWK
jgi:hypothetical protein